MRFKDLTGQRFGRLTVTRFIGRDLRAKTSQWECLCDCGNTCIATAAHLGRHTHSCGCLRRENSAAMHRIHGKTRTPEHGTWTWMRNRCLNPTNQRYSEYGGRGIKICERWLESFENFFADMGPRPSPQHSIERENNNGNYEPGNCKWATRTEQNRNSRQNVKLTHNGETLTVAEWTQRLGFKRATLYYRISAGWSVSRALTTPLQAGPYQRKVA